MGENLPRGYDPVVDGPVEPEKERSPVPPPIRHRMDSIIPTLGREGTMILPKSHTGESLAIFTSGGDSQG